jgi:signal transduction histidine kinase
MILSVSSNQTNRRITRAVRYLSRLSAAAVLALSFSVLVGYALRIDTLIFVFPGHQGMALLTAIGLFAIAAGLLCEAFESPRTAATAALSAFSLSVAVMLEQAFLGRDGLSPQLAALLFHLTPAHSGRTSVATAAGIGFLSIALLLRDRARVSDTASGVALLLGAVAVLGYWYGVRDLYAIPIFDTMAVHTAIALVLLALASFFQRPQLGFAAVVSSHRTGGSTTRRQLLFTFMPPVAGWLLLQSVQAHRLGVAAAMALLVIIVIVPLVLLILRDGRMLDLVEAEREAKVDMQLSLGRELEERLAQQARELETESARHTAAEAALAQAQRLEAVGRLTGGIAHDFNNVLMGISGNVEILMKLLPAEDPLRRFAQSAKNSIQRGTRLTAQLMTFSRVQKLEIRSLELDVVVQDAQALLANAIGPNIQLEWRLDASGDWILGDADQLPLALVNLAFNAREAMPDGGTIMVSTGRRSHEGASSGEDARQVFVQVTDSGSGMAPDVLSHAVEPFFTTKGQETGSGLGLAQVHGVVSQCGGELVIRSELGKGTTVQMIFPVLSRLPDIRATADAETPDIRMASTQTLRVLLVDDDENVRTALAGSLRTAGHTVVEAADGVDGLAKLEASEPDIAIIDFMMPGMNGAEVASRARVDLPRLPIVFISGYSNTELLSKISGAVVLRKPFDLASLQRAMESVRQSAALQ